MTLWLGFLLSCAAPEPTYAPVATSPATPVAPLIEQRFTLQSQKADVLIIVSNGSSMEDNRPVPGASDPLFEVLRDSAVDFQIATVQTYGWDFEIGRIENIILRDTAEAELTLFAGIDRPMSGLGSGADTSALLDVVENPNGWGLNGEFYRSDADLHVVHLSDSPVTGTLFSGSYEDWIENEKAAPLSVVVHCIGGRPGCPRAQGTAVACEIFYAPPYGGVYDICVEDWSPHFRDIGERVVNTVRRRVELYLRALPEVDPWTIEVELQQQTTFGIEPRLLVTCLEGEEDPDCEAYWVPERNSVYVPDGPEGWEVVIRYQARREGL